MIGSKKGLLCKLYSLFRSPPSGISGGIVIKFNCCCDLELDTVTSARRLVNKKRPINLNPLSIRLPLSAWISISHRLSGILVFLLIPLVLWGWQRSLASPEGLNQAKDLIVSSLGKFVVWIGLAGILFHLCAGCRHLLMDWRVGDSLKGGKIGACIVLLLSGGLILGVTFWIGS